MRNLAIILATVLAAGPALAHPGAHDHAGVAYGLVHPLTGLDHLLAMLAVGLLASLMRGRALWLVPAAFVVMMVLGGALAMAGAAVLQVEFGIALSVVVIGGLVALGRRLPLALAMGTVGLFAVFHGAAHGMEMPAAVSALGYGAGITLATLALHAAGIAAGLGLAGASRALGPRVAGGLIALAGAAVLGGTI